jgi:hypothetical protein
MPASLSITGCTFASTVYSITSASVKDQKDQIDVTVLTDATSKQYQASPLFQPKEVSLDFIGYGPRAGVSGGLSLAGISGLGATVVSSSTTFQLNEPIRSQATLNVSTTKA